MHEQGSCLEDLEAEKHATQRQLDDIQRTVDAVRDSLKAKQSVAKQAELFKDKLIVQNKAL
jgi:hypothetical protein